MARSIGMDTNRLYRAVIVKTYPEAPGERPETTTVHAEGPYVTAGLARARLTWWKGYADRSCFGPAKVTGHVEKAELTWERVE
ncbi:hypothetical protein [Streptomyces sp. NPDC059080]|uniref:hypothetical protein n=1 Tax=Streptomyces sp. NPDC059080 TaxID=3346718 RepID=UPI0036CEB74F